MNSQRTYKNLVADGYATLEENTEDTAIPMFTPEEQEQLIQLSRRFTKNLTELVRGNEDEK